MRQQLSESYLSQYYWNKDGDKIFGHPDYGNGYIYDGTITTVADAADFAVTARDNASVEALAAAKKVIVYVPRGVVSIEFRFRSTSAAATQDVVEMFAAAGKDHYDLVAQLTIDVGTQQYATGVLFHDTIVPATEKWLTAASELSTTANNIGRYTLNTHGYDRFWFVASTLNSTILYIDWKQL